MFSPSDYNDAVPQFTNGNYANTPLNPLYVEEPDAVNYNRGAEPLQTLPAQWWNWLCNKITAKLNKLNIYVKNIFDELTQLLSLVGVTPDATEEEPTIGQLKDVFDTKYPPFLYTKLHSEVASDTENKFVSAKGLYSYTLGSTTTISWLNKAFGKLLGRLWIHVPSFSKGQAFRSRPVVLYHNGLYVTGCSYTNSSAHDAGIWWSTDGINWTQGTSDYTYFADSVLGNIFFVNNLWIAVLITNRTILWSEDGKFWTQGTGFTGVYGNYNCIFVNGLFYLAGAFDDSAVCWSEDGKSWTPATGFVSEETLYSILYNNGLFVAGSLHGPCWSTDGKSWNYGSGGHTYLVRTEILYVNGLWVAPSQNHGVWWSEDGKSWTQGTGSNTSYYATRLEYYNGIFVCVMQDHGIWWSEDGKSWTVSNVTTQTYNLISHANGMWIVTATDASTPQWSVNGKKWFAINTMDDDLSQTYEMLYINGLWIAGTGIHSVIISEDGINWKPSSLYNNGSELKAWGITFAGDKLFVGMTTPITDYGLYYSTIDSLIEEGCFTGIFSSTHL